VASPEALWQEVGDRVFTRRYRFMHQQIGAILTDDGPVIIDTRSTVGHAREVLADLRTLSRQPVAAVIDTHHHFDHSFGNHEFRPAPIWGTCAAPSGSGPISETRPPMP
jgi:glyoxylase-like metal-dependent hydrolase (beta-lactamase superfamily II)